MFIIPWSDGLKWSTPIVWDRERPTYFVLPKQHPNDLTYFPDGKLMPKKCKLVYNPIWHYVFIYIYINDISKCTYIAPSILVGLIIPFRQVICLLLCLLHPCQAHLQRALEKIEKETPLRPTKFGFVTVENLRQNTEKHQFNHHSTY